MTQLATKNYDHLGIVSGVFDELGFVELLNTLSASDPQRKVSVGIAVKAMVLNGLGFVNKALYLTPKFFESKAVDLLLGEEYKASDFDSHSLGTALDCLYAKGLSTIFFQLSLHARQYYGIETTSRQMDGTNFSVYKSKHLNEGGELGDGVVRFVPGHNKQGRHSQPQFVLEMIDSNVEGIPEYIDFADGNVTDKTAFPGVLEGFIKEMKAASEDWQTAPYIADSALYTSSTISSLSDSLSELIWLSRVPRTIKACQQIAQSSWGASKQWIASCNHSGYFYQERTSNYGEVAQQWFVFYSEAGYSRACKSVEKKVAKQLSSLSKAAKALSKKHYKSAGAAKASVSRWYKGLSKSEKTYFTVSEVSVNGQARYGRGRPKANAIPKRIDYEVATVSFNRKEAVIRKEVENQATFILATNQTDQALLNAEQALHLYKNEQQKVEKGFKFLKDPLFMLDKLFLTLPQRIMALTMVMCLSLLIYTLAQYKLRKALKDTGETLPNQSNKPISNPTMRWVFMLLQGIHILYLREGSRTTRMILNVTEVQRKIIQLMGSQVQLNYNVK